MLRNERTGKVTVLAVISQTFELNSNSFRAYGSHPVELIDTVVYEFAVVAGKLE